MLRFGKSVMRFGFKMLSKAKNMRRCVLVANIGHGEKYEQVRKRLLLSAAKLFLQQGYSMTSLKELAADAGTNTGVLMRTFGSKENILAVLVKFVLEEQFSHAAKLVADKTEDKILFYAAETTLQLHIVESNENLRELYAAAYSLPNTTEVIQETITNKLEQIFKEHLPDLDTTDFYMLEIASGGIMRGFMTIPCSMLLTMEKKVKAFLETTFSLYKVPEAKVQEAIEFVSQFDFKQLAEETIQEMLEKVGEMS